MKQFLIFIVLLSGCAHVNIKVNSFVDPDFKGKTYHTIMVMAVLPEWTEKESFENFLSDQIQKTTTAASITSSYLFLPTRSYSLEEKSAITTRSGVDAILAIKITDTYYDEQYIPASSNTTGQVTVHQNLANFSSYTSHYGGYYASSPRQKYALYLFDAKTGKVAWIGSSLAKGNRRTSLKHLQKSISVNAIKELVKGGFFVKKEE